MGKLEDIYCGTTLMYIILYTEPLFYCNRVQFVGERIPTLREAVSLCKELDLVMFIEVKHTTNIERVSSKTMTKGLVISSMTPHFSGSDTNYILPVWCHRPRA